MNRISEHIVRLIPGKSVDITNRDNNSGMGGLLSFNLKDMAKLIVPAAIVSGAIILAAVIYFVLTRVVPKYRNNEEAEPFEGGSEHLE